MNKLLLTLITLLLIVPLALAANPGHNAGSISPGTFNAGNFTFQNQVSVGGNFIVDQQAFIVDASNNRVGVNWNSDFGTPTHTLSVYGGPGIRWYLDTGAPTFQLFDVTAPSDNAQLSLFNSMTTKNVQLSTDGNSYIRVGNLGIGTTTPTSRLYVEGNITVNSTSDICIEGGACLSDGGSGNITGSGTTNTIPLWTGSATLSNSFFTQTASAVTVGADLVIPSNNFIIDTNTFFVNATSNRVGINTNNPQATLDVNGSVALNNNNVTNVQCITFASGGEICST